MPNNDATNQPDQPVTQPSAPVPPPPEPALVELRTITEGRAPDDRTSVVQRLVRDVIHAGDSDEGSA